jgi:hypothetical protein
VIRKCQHLEAFFYSRGAGLASVYDERVQRRRDNGGVRSGSRFLVEKTVNNFWGGIGMAESTVGVQLGNLFKVVGEGSGFSQGCSRTRALGFC